jgi:hypothetical protein
MKPVRKATDERLVENIHGRLARLERRQGVGSEVIDLIDYLYRPNTTPGGTYKAWDPLDLGDGPYAGFHVTGGRCFLYGAVTWTDNATTAGIRQLVDNATKFPADARPPHYTKVPLFFDPTNCSFSPAMQGGSDAPFGAMIAATIQTDGYISFDNVTTGYNGQMRNAGGTVFTNGVPNGTTLFLEGVSWRVG